MMVIIQSLKMSCAMTHTMHASANSVEELDRVYKSILASVNVAGHPRFEVWVKVETSIPDLDLPVFTEANAPAAQEMLYTPNKHAVSLTEFGYYNVIAKNVAERQRALEHAIQAKGQASVVSKLLFLVATEKDNVRGAIYREDCEWAQML